MPGEKAGRNGGKKERKMEEREKRLVQRAWNEKKSLTISVPASQISKCTVVFSFSHKMEHIQT